MNPDFKKYLLNVTESKDCSEREIIQSLWSGYGAIRRYHLLGGLQESVVVKHIQTEHSGKHPRGWDTDISHKRKIESYKVETQWYERWSSTCPDDCRVPTFLGSFQKGQDQYIILEDLDSEYPERRHHLKRSEIKVCLSWLAHFHVTFLGRAPRGLWEVGTYWNLETRPDEFARIKNDFLKSKAKLIDDMLNQCTYKTIVHGDAKLANFCFSKNGLQVAAVDFQYVGGGCGIKDVAYFLGSCLTGPECAEQESELLDYYFQSIENALLTSYMNINFPALKEEWSNLYPVACTDFVRFMLGWMPSHRKINQYNLDKMNMVLAGL